MNTQRPIFVGTAALGVGEPKICVPITGRTKEEIKIQTKKIKEANPDIVEWRGDLYEDIMQGIQNGKAAAMAEEIKEILGDIPLLFTFRTKNEGGNIAISPDDYIQLNQRMSMCAAIELQDVEVFMDLEKMKTLIKEVQKNKKVVIGSHHRFDTTPSNEVMTEVLTTIESAGADVLKLAVMPQTESDVERLMTVTKGLSQNHVSHPVVTMSMGALGVKTRICGKKFGSAMTFACVGEASAPGQLEINDLREKMKSIS